MGSLIRLLNISNCLKTCPASFLSLPASLSTGASFLLSTLNSFKECQRSAAAAAHDLILAELDSKCQFVVDTTPLKKIRYALDLTLPPP